MARMPTAKWQPLAANFASQPKMRAFDIICIHTMVGGLTGTDGYFRNGNGVGYAGTESHFGTGGAGEIVQWQDTAYQAEANLNGNHHIISIENADMGPGFPKWNTADGSAVPAFTPQQVEAIAQIIAWACRTHNIPCVLIPDAKPGRRGIGYHRQGVPGYMVAGAEKWSNATGKVCPGSRRIAQIPNIVARAQAILAGRPATPTPTKEDDMPLNANDIAIIKDLLRTEVIDREIARTPDGKPIQLWQRVNALADAQQGFGRRIEDIQARNVALQAVVTQLTTTPGRDGMTAEQIEALVEKVIRENVVRVDVKVEGQ